MKSKKIISLCLAAFCCLGIVGCGNTDTPPEKNEPVLGEYNQITFYEKLFGNRRDYSEKEFFDPANEYRMLPVINEDASKPKGASIANLEKLKDYGYGGVVTNVAWSDDYLNNDFAWELLEEAVTYAIEDLGLRVWLYDEYAYPSGGARDIVLKDNPEWQAQGVAQKNVIVPNGKTKSIACPDEHTLIAANAYKGTGIADVSVQGAMQCEISADGTASFTNTTGTDCILVCLYSKNWYEGTHPQWNIMESRRYIDVMRSEPVEKFLNVTYEKYKEHLGKYFNNGIESFFYDEPALAGMYKSSCSVLNVLDPPNENLEFLDTYNYSPILSEYFQQKWGYDPTPYLPYLYKQGSALNQSEEAMRFRLQFNDCIAELFATNYFKQIGDWCDKNNINASGHLLGEESPASCVLYSGNVMRNYANVQIPGIDLLSGDPAVTASWSNVMKACSSSAQFYGKSRVFCEVSDWGYQNENWDARIASVAVQYACGVNTFVSYYEPFNFDAETNRYFADTTARIGYMLGGGIGQKNVAIYYPMEGLYAASTNADTNNFSNNSMVSAISDNFRDLTHSLLKNQIDYENFDAQMVLETKIENGMLVTPAGERFSAIVVPKTCAMYYDVLEKLYNAAESGIQVLLQDSQGWICERAEDQAKFNELFNKLIKHRNVSVKKSNAITVSALSEHAFVQANSEDIVACKQVNENNSVYLICNTAAAQKNITLRLSDEGKTFKLWNLYDGSVQTITPTASVNGWSEFRLPFDQYKCAVITAE